MFDEELIPELTYINQKLEFWTSRYNTYRPHQSLNYLTPLEYYQLSQQKKGEKCTGCSGPEQVLDKSLAAIHNKDVKKIVFTLTFFIFKIIFISSVLASGFQLKTIGALDVDGVTTNHIWYTNGNITFTGIAIPNSEIEVSVDGTIQKINADSSGNWIFRASLAEGDHNLVFTSGGSSISKTLTVGNVPENIGSLPKASTPTVGNIYPTMILLLLGGGFFLPLPFLFLKKS